jgi:hypothetical protein
MRCTSYGQALYNLPGSKLKAPEAANWFKVFYQGLAEPNFFPYSEAGHFENPVRFKLDMFADDLETRQLFSLMIKPCFLPVGMSSANRTVKPGYEAYQPVLMARQFGLGQVPPYLFINHLTQVRADLPNGLAAVKCYSCFDNLQVSIPPDTNLCFTTDGFGTWWSLWKSHVFWRQLGARLLAIDRNYHVREEEVKANLILLYSTLYKPETDLSFAGSERS